MMKIATIGSGPIVHDFLDAVTRVEGAECVAVYSRKEETALSLAGKFKIQQVYTDLNTMLLDSNVNTIYIASPNSLHYEQALQALTAGKHVILEKPFTSNYEEAKKLYEIAYNKKLFLFEAITTIHMPNYRLVKENLDKIGRIRLVQCNYSQYSSRYQLLLKGETPNIFNPKFSGGALMDINLYNLHFILGLFGSPKSTQYFPNKHKNGIDTSGIAVLEYSDFVVQATGAKDSNSMNFVQIQGENGYIHVIGGSNGCKEIEVVLNDGTIEKLNEQDEENRLVYELRTFVKTYNNKDCDKSFTLLDNSLQLMKLLDSLREDGGIAFAADM